MHNAHVGDGRDSVVALGIFPPLFLGGGREGVDTGTIFGVKGDGCDIVLISWMGVSMTYGVRGRVGGSRYYMRIPKVKPGRLRVAMIGFLTIPNGGKRNGIVWMENETQ